MKQIQAQTGAGAVDRSVALRKLAENADLADDQGGATGLVAQKVKGHTFYLVAGVWVDSRFRQDMAAGAEKVEAYSDEYFALLAEHPELAKVLAFSSRRVIVVEGKAIEIVDEEE
jgi:hypothetical protein